MFVFFVSGSFICIFVNLLPFVLISNKSWAIICFINIYVYTVNFFLSYLYIYNNIKKVDFFSWNIKDNFLTELQSWVKANIIFLISWKGQWILHPYINKTKERERDVNRKRPHLGNQWRSSGARRRNTDDAIKWYDVTVVAKYTSAGRSQHLAAEISFSSSFVHW